MATCSRIAVYFLTFPICCSCQYIQVSLVYGSDINVSVLLMAYHNLLSIRNVYFGANAKKTNIDSLLEFLGSKHVKCLLTLHCLTGCNTVGKFHNVSKESWTKLFLQTKDQDIFKTFESLQQEFMPKTIHYLAKFTFWGYINRPKHQNLTTLAEV